MDFKNTIEFQIYADIWNFHKRHYATSDSDEYWEAAIEDADRLYKKYNGLPFVRALVMAVLAELERKSREAVQNEAH